MALILVIDDEPSVRKTVRKILAQAGHTVIEAPDGHVGLKMLKAHRPSIVITDLVMPRMEGIEVIREVRRAQPATRIVAMSGGGPRQEKMYLGWAASLGADALLEKPFRAAELIALLGALLPHAGDP